MGEHPAYTRTVGVRFSRWVRALDLCRLDPDVGSVYRFVLDRFFAKLLRIPPT